MITGIRIVLTPESVVIAEARRLFTALALHGYAVDAVVVNRVLPPDPDNGHGFLADWRAAQAANLPLIEESFATLPTLRVEMRGHEPVGVARLTDVADELFSGRDPVAGPVPAAGLHTEGSDGRYRLLISLPLAERGDINLGRVGVDLIVTVGAHRRRIALPSTLQRCRTTGAQFTDEALVVEFEADPDLWPAALAGALSANRTAADLAPAG